MQRRSGLRIVEFLKDKLSRKDLYDKMLKFYA
jgi:hypothetical protein